MKRVRFFKWLLLVAGSLVGLSLLLAGQRPFREFPGMEGRDTEAALPTDYQVKAELVLGRLMYPSGGGGFGRGGGNWTNGGTHWTVDYPKGDRLFAQALRRLTRVNVRSVEQPTNPDDEDDIYYWPYLHVAMPVSWTFTEAQAKKIREWFDRGGFMVVDSFFGSQEWKGFEVGLKQIFPDRQVEELPNDDSIFHTVYDLSERYQIGNWRSVVSFGRSYRNSDGAVPYWRCIRDAKGRVVVAINFNNDMGDSWQWADNPRYDEKWSALGIRLGINYVTYAMTH